MGITNKQTYIPPRTLGSVGIRLETSLLFGSVVDYINPVETAGQSIGDFFDSAWPESTFNHTWEE